MLKVAGAEPCPVLLAALAPKMLALAGSVADGTVTWMAGPKTVRDHIVPSIQAAAEAAGKPKPRVVVGLPIAVTDDVPAARAAAAKRYAVYGQLPSYRAMLDREGAEVRPRSRSSATKRKSPSSSINWRKRRDALQRRAVPDRRGSSGLDRTHARRAFAAHSPGLSSRHRAGAALRRSTEDMQLAHETIVEPGEQPREWVMFLHGILGRGSNWQTFAKRVCKARPSSAHCSRSARARRVASVSSAAHACEDSRGCSRAVAIRRRRERGRRTFVRRQGRALAARRCAAESARAVGARQLAWLAPRAQRAGRDQSRDRGATRAARGAEQSRRLIAALQERGISQAIARWLAKNVVRDGEALRFGVDLDAIDALIAELRSNGSMAGDGSGDARCAAAVRARTQGERGSTRGSRSAGATGAARRNRSARVAGCGALVARR